jgi:hypothetical protein
MPTMTLEQTLSGAMTPPPSLSPEFVHRSAWKAGVLASINVLVMVLSARLIMMVAVSGGIALTWLVLQQADPYRLIGLAIYAAGVVLPAVYLAASGRA